MTAATVHIFAATSAARAELGRLCRQFCLTRENAASTALPSLDEELARAVESVRAQHGSDSISDDEALECLHAEQARVADARVLAELIAARLAQSPATAPSSAPSSASTAPAPRPRTPLSTSAAATAPARSGPPDIADLLDGMLAQDRANERTRREAVGR